VAPLIMKNFAYFQALMMVLCLGAVAVLIPHLIPYLQPFSLNEVLVIFTLLVVFFWPRRIER
jgi:hypothetical protein